MLSVGSAVRRRACDSPTRVPFSASLGTRAAGRAALWRWDDIAADLLCLGGELSSRREANDVAALRTDIKSPRRLRGQYEASAARLIARCRCWVPPPPHRREATATDSPKAEEYSRGVPTRAPAAVLEAVSSLMITLAPQASPEPEFRIQSSESAQSVEPTREKKSEFRIHNS